MALGARPRRPRTGLEVTISYEGRTFDATVQTTPFHDPEGTLVRS